MGLSLISFGAEELADFFIQEFQVCRIRSCSGCVSPERWDGRKGDCGHETRLIAGVGYWKI